MTQTKTEIILEWVPACQYFLMKSRDGNITLQEIRENTDPWKLLSCLGVLMKFPGRDKEKAQRYNITIEHLGDV